MKALDGFLIVLSTDGDVIYVSENIHDFIGIQQVINSVRYDYALLCEILNGKNLFEKKCCFCRLT